MFEKYICTTCGTQNTPKRKNKGSLAGEILLWIAMLILFPFTYGFSLAASLIYSLWRVFNYELVCPSCKKPDMVDIKSPKGKKLIQEYHEKQQ